MLRLNLVYVLRARAYGAGFNKLVWPLTTAYCEVTRRLRKLLQVVLLAHEDYR
jgi:hypothetical protein